MSDHARRTRISTLLLEMLVLLAVAACGDRGSLEGTYHHPQGAFVLELKGGHKAVLQMLGETIRCSWDASAEQVKLSCPDSPFTQQIGTLARNEDGTLSSALGVLAKRPPG
jgi:hypothetical protein